MTREPFVYILASRFRGTIYIGVTSNLMARIWQHRKGSKPGFTSRYSICRLVHYEPFADMESAIAREKQLKRWHRQWKINLIEEKNPHWDDLAVALGFERLDETPTTHRRSGPDADPVSASTDCHWRSGGLDPETSSG
jgi:putative endonuclease